MSDGIFKIRIPGFGIKGVDTDNYVSVKCDQYGWATFQARGQFGNSIHYFNRSFEEYRNGFGELDKEFWLGLDVLHAMTDWRPYNLKISLWGAEDTGYAEAYYKYDLLFGIFMSI